MVFGNKPHISAFAEASWDYLLCVNQRMKAAHFPIYNGEPDMDAYGDLLTWHPCLSDALRKDIISFIEQGYNEGPSGRQLRIMKLRHLNHQWRGRQIELPQKPGVQLQINYVGPWSPEDVKIRTYHRHPSDPQVLTWYAAVTVLGVGYFFHLGLEHLTTIEPILPVPTVLSSEPLQPWTSAVIPTLIRV